MAPTTLATPAQLLEGRALCPSGYFYDDGFCYRRSGWYWWGRWVLTGVLILCALVFLILLAFSRNRSRRRAARTGRPVAGGWMNWGGRPAQQPQYGNQHNYAAPPPQYTQQPDYTGASYNSNAGYYGQTPAADPNVQQPPNTYYPTRAAGAEDYAPPEGPPPAKH